MIDPSTPEGFKATRENAGLSLNVVSVSIGVDLRTLERWESDRPDSPAPNPTAARMLVALAKGFQPRSKPVRITGPAFRQRIEELGMSIAKASDFLDVDIETLEHWMSDDRGPNPIAVRALDWHEEGWNHE